MKTYKLKLKDIKPKLAKEIIRTKKGQEVFERSKRAEELRKQGNVSDMFKTMFGQQ